MRGDRCAYRDESGTQPHATPVLVVGGVKVHLHSLLSVPQASVSEMRWSGAFGSR